jgi:hypothetical protein
MTRSTATALTVSRILSSRALNTRDITVIRGALNAAPLRLAVAATGTGCGKGSARQAAWLMSKVGYTVDATTLVTLWGVAYEAADRNGHWVDPTELSRTAAALAGYESYEAWRRAMCDAFDAVKRPHMTQDEAACAWSHMSARVAVLHLLRVTVDEVSDLATVVHGWLPEQYRGDVRGKGTQGSLVAMHAASAA